VDGSLVDLASAHERWMGGGLVGGDGSRIAKRQRSTARAPLSACSTSSKGWVGVAASSARRPRRATTPSAPRLFLDRVRGQVEVPTLSVHTVHR
jgi:hypothetical protein